MLQCAAESCRVLQCVVFDIVMLPLIPSKYLHVLQCVAVRSSVLQCVAVCRRVLQFIAVCCSVLQCVAVFCVLQCVVVMEDW